MEDLKPNEELFWSHVDQSGGPEACHTWTARLGTTGYGAVSITRGGAHKTFKAHRLAWEFTNGPIPDGLFVLHRCDNPPCVNVAHLFLGTNRDNVLDMMAKGRRVQAIPHPHRRARGERHGRAKLVEQQVVEIKNRLSKGETQRSIAADFEVLPGTIGKIARGEKWTHVQGAPV